MGVHVNVTDPVLLALTVGPVPVLTHDTLTLVKVGTGVSWEIVALTLLRFVNVAVTVNGAPTATVVGLALSEEI